MTGEELREYQSRVGSLPKRQPLKLPDMETPEDAQAALKTLIRATAQGTVTEKLATRLEAQVKLWLEYYHTEVRDFEKELSEHEERVKQLVNRRLRT